MQTNNKINFWGEFMSSLHKNLHKYLKIKLEDIDLKKGEVHFLHYICENKSVKQNTLSKCFNVDKSTTTRKVKKLIKQGYITREVDQKDHRKYLLYPTKKGEDLSNYICDVFNSWNNEITKNLTEDEIKLFKKISESIINNSDELIERIYLNEQE